MRMNKWMTVGLALALAIGLTSCGTKGGEASNANKAAEVVEELVPDYSYEAQYLTLPEDENYYNSMLAGSAMYCMTYAANEEGDYVTSLVKNKVTEQGVEAGKAILELHENEEFYCMGLDGKENLYLLLGRRPEIPEDQELDEAFYENYYRSASYHLLKYDQETNLVFDEEVTEAFQDLDYFYASLMAVDAQENVYLLNDSQGIFLFGADGRPAGKILMEGNWCHSLGRAKDGKVYAQYVAYSSEGSKNSLSQVDFENKKLVNSQQGFLSTDGNACLMVEGTEGDLLGYDENGLYEYSLEKQEAGKLLTWLDCDIDGSSVESVSLGESNVIYVLLRNWESGQTEIARMNKVRTEDMVKRDIITIGVLYGNNDLSRRIVEFNKNNAQYRVKIKSYMDLNNATEDSYKDAITNLNNDLTSGNAPDVIDLSGLDVENLVKKGVLEDLAPYVAKSSIISKEDVFPAIWKGATYDGVLTFVPSGFVLRTLAAKEKLVGSREGWTCKDMIELAKRFPEADLLEYGNKESALNMMLTLGKEHFIDESAHACHFDTEDFKEVLQFANMFPDEVSYSERLVPYRLKDDSLLVVDADIYDFNEVQSILAYFDDEKVNFIGYPTYGDGNGCIIIPSNSYGMVAKSEHKEGAWQLIESLINVDVENDWSFWGFSSFISRFEKQKEKALEVEYVFDENGEILLDDEGNPVYEGGSSYTMMGDNGEEWSYHYRPITAEEVETVERLLNHAVLKDSSFGYGISDENALNQIIFEEASAYFKGSKSLDEVVSIIQNRANLYLKENE